jgi:hypothetical protein
MSRGEACVLPPSEASAQRRGAACLLPLSLTARIWRRAEASSAPTLKNAAGEGKSRPTTFSQRGKREC